MGQRASVRTLRDKPDINQLRRQAKELLRGFQSGEPAATAEVNAYYRRANPATFALHDAQLVLARSHGFESWPKLKAFVDGVNVRRLAEAVERGDLEQVRKMLDARPELVNTGLAENNEHRALHYAVFRRSPEMVRLLMERGASARKGIYPHREATSALTIAVERGYDEIAAIILEEERRRLGQSHARGADAVTQAIADGDEARALAMLAAKPSLARARNRNGWTPLHVAAAARSGALVRWLLEHDADANSRGPRGRTPLDQAVGTPWRDAGAGEEFAAIAAMLLEHGARMTARAAVALGGADWLRARHAEGALENPIEDWGGLLTVAVLHDRPEMLALLLDLGFDPGERVRLEDLDEVVYSQGMPLWHCAAGGKLAMAELLLERGANPNAHVYASGTPVYSAYRGNQRPMVELLKRHGGLVDPITIGIFHERELARQALLDGAADPRVSEDLLRGAAEGGDAGIVQMALPGVDWPRGDERWYWILMQAVWSGDLECVRPILARCDPNLRHPRFPRTILHDVAGLRGIDGKAPELAALLLDAGARLDARDGVLHSTPLGWACRWGRLELARLLLERGADPVEEDAEPWARPRAWAEKKGRDAVLALLREFGG